MGQLNYYLYCKTRCIIGIGQQDMQINKLNSVHLICANMNALVLLRLIFTLIKLSETD